MKTDPFWNGNFNDQGQYRLRTIGTTAVYRFPVSKHHMPMNGPIYRAVLAMTLRDPYEQVNVPEPTERDKTDTSDREDHDDVLDTLYENRIIDDNTIHRILEA